MTAAIATIPKKQFFKANGDPLVGGRLYTYLAGTSTPTATWQEEDQTTLNTNPIILDGRGECLLWLAPGQQYRLALHDAADALIWSVDDVGGGVSAGALGNTTDIAQGDALVGVRFPAAGATGTTQHEHNAREIWIEDFGALTDGSDSTLAINAAFAAAKAFGGAQVRAGRGTFSCNASLTMQGSGISFIGQGKGATRIAINHNAGEPGIRIANLAVPGRIERCGVFAMTLVHAVTPAPAVQLTDMIRAEYVRGLAIMGVDVENGKATARVSGCSDVAIDSVDWRVTEGTDTNRHGVIIDHTTATYAGAGEKFGRRISVSRCRFADDGYVPNSGSFRFASGVDLVCGQLVTLGEVVVAGARNGVILDRSTGQVAAGAPVELSDITIKGGTFKPVAKGIMTDNTGGGMVVGGLDIECNTLEGNLGSTRGIEFSAGVVMTKVAINDNRVRFFLTSPMQLLATTDTLSVDDNEIGGNSLNLAGISVNNATNFTVNDNVMTGVFGTGIDILAACDRFTVNDNVINGSQPGIKLANGAQRFVVWGNQIVDEGGGEIVDLTGSTWKKIQGKPIAFSAYVTSNYATATPLSKISFLSEEYDQGGYYTPGTSIFQPLVPGLYQVHAAISMLTAASSGQTSIRIYKNGVQVKSGTSLIAAAGTATALTVSAAIEMNGTSDQLEIQVSGPASGTTIYGGNAASYFQATLIN